MWRGLNVPLELMDARKWRYQWEQEQIEEVGHMKGSDWNKKLFAFLACELRVAVWMWKLYVHFFCNEK